MECLSRFKINMNLSFTRRFETKDGKMKALSNNLIYVVQ